MKAGQTSHCQLAEKPGRTMITFLLILNLAMWILKTFEFKHAATHPLYMTHYNELLWKFIINVALPLIVFFHFHSTVCLADVWSCTYRFYGTASLR
ncbi:otopetrin [Echinococcus granulosus]|uniref:Otopetrin n=1 Tax=Echinococcus granulosus TaxID=6210 RepID=W6U233_ECHGR|nr:otopetrin [Echinococcus granulosus]EUB55108.1 otopetrin [Echinococcus granulosus]